MIDFKEDTVFIYVDNEGEWERLQRWAFSNKLKWVSSKISDRISYSENIPYMLLNYDKNNKRNIYRGDMVTYGDAITYKDATKSKGNIIKYENVSDFFIDYPDDLKKALDVIYDDTL